MSIRKPGRIQCDPVPVNEKEPHIPFSPISREELFTTRGGLCILPLILGEELGERAGARLRELFERKED